MVGMSPELVQTALNNGWTREQVFNLHLFAINRNWAVEDVSQSSALVLTGLVPLIYTLGRSILELDLALDRPGNKVVIYTDGSGTGGPAGIGVVIEETGKEGVLIGEAIGNATNNVAELKAIWRGLQAFPDVTREIVIRTDSMYSIGVLTENWKLRKNVELIKDIRQNLAWREKKVVFQHVAGHAGIEGNEMADKLANQARLSQIIPREIS